MIELFTQKLKYLWSAFIVLRERNFIAGSKTINKKNKTKKRTLLIYLLGLIIKYIKVLEVITNRYLIQYEFFVIVLWELNHSFVGYVS